MSIQKTLERHSDKIFFHPRTGEKIIGSTDGDRVHNMPPTRKNNLNGCPRTTWHRRTNRPTGMTTKGLAQGKPTGQLKTVWGSEQGNYAGFHQILAGNDKGNRFLPPQREAKSARCGNREWRRL